MRGWKYLGLALITAQLGGCGGEGASESSSGESAQASAESAGEIVTPPFAVRGDADGLLLTWFDHEGPHTAASRHEIPEERRGEVRVDSLEIPPDERDPEHVFVADLREPGDDGRYVVRRLPRDAFDRRVETFGDVLEGGGPESTGEVASSDVVVFGASWCGACRETEAYLRGRGIPFVERDIEREPGAREDMQRRAAAAGVSPRGIPVIDFRGRIIQGFDRQALDRAIRETAAGSGGGGGGITI
jgi:glutaredoxin